ncbi:unnamed protein product [Rotaria sp. Silwood1]|nr:unnamed protein product [Rotaria sp. Silwood1]CAF4985503.1 unnamed protein product [Rotaria sp. Silwood1]
MERGNYSKEDFLKAFHEYKNGATSSAVTVKYNVPGSTIRNHKSNPTMKIGGGRPTLLTNDQEQKLVELLKNLEVAGVRLTKLVVMKLASEYVQLVTSKFVELGRKWLKNFLQRWQGELKVIREEKIEASRRNGFTEDVRRGWFEKLDLILRTNNLITRPHAIYNCDETGFSDETSCEMIVVSHETKHAYEQSGGSGKNFTTSLICGNAAGEILPPFIIYPAKILNPQWTFGGPPGSSFAVSDSGWITKSLFSEWFNRFVEHTRNVSKPILLIMDNHACHISIEVIEVAKQNQILLLLLPPSCTHALQPLDTVTFSSAKQSWKRIVTNYFLRSGRKTIRKIDLPLLFNKLYSSAFIPKQVVAGFSRAGVWPFDSNAMKDKVARQPLATKQINQLSQSLNSANHSTSSTTALFDASNITPVTLSYTSASSSYLHNQNVSSIVLDFDHNIENDLKCISNENNSVFIPITEPKNNLSLSTNLDSPSLFGQLIGNTRLQNTNPTPHTSCSSFVNPFDLLRFPSFISNASLNSNSFNNFDLPSDEFNDSALPINTNLSFKRIGESNESFSKAPVPDADSNEEDDGQQILGFDPRTLPKTYGRYSRYPNEHHQQLTSIIDFEKENYEGNRTYTELTSVNMQRSDPPSENFQHDLFSFENQMINPIPSRQLSPSSAARSIFTNILQQHVPSSSSSSNRIKRTRTEGKYGEEITSSNRLNELKEKTTTLNLKKRSIKSTKQTSSTSVLASGADLETTTRKKRKISKQHSEIITSSQATRAIATLETPSPSNEGSNQNNTSPSLQTQQQHSSNN